MAEPSLDRPGVVAPVGERIAAGVAQHVRMDLEFEARAGGGPLDHPGKAGSREWGAADTPLFSLSAIRYSLFA